MFWQAPPGMHTVTVTNAVLKFGPFAGPASRITGSTFGGPGVAMTWPGGGGGGGPMLELPPPPPQAVSSQQRDTGEDQGLTHSGVNPSERARDGVQRMSSAETFCGSSEGTQARPAKARMRPWFWITRSASWMERCRWLPCEAAAACRYWV